MAADYRAALENKDHLLVTRKTVVRRALVIRWKDFMGTSVSYRDIAYRGQVHDVLTNKLYGVENTVRVWVVRDADGTVEHARWERYIMAKAHRDGRMYHYAKYIMTEGDAQWMKEISGGLSTRKS
jgi:hypothetical protein